MFIKQHISPDTDILPPRYDTVFKSLLTRDEEESRIALMDFISSIIGQKVIDVIILNNELATTGITEMQERFDINCKIESGELLNIEMQMKPMEEQNHTDMKNLKKRIGYYAADLYSSQGVRGKNGYQKLAKVYQITIADFTIFPKYKPFINHFQLRNVEGELFTEDINIVIIELSKLSDLLKKSTKELSALEQWSLFFKYVDDTSKREVINQIMDEKEAIAMAGAMLQTVSRDEHERAKYRSRMKFINDLDSDLSTATERGRQEGREEGVTQVAKNLLLIGQDISLIMRATGLTEKEIRRLAN